MVRDIELNGELEDTRLYVEGPIGKVCVEGPTETLFPLRLSTVQTDGLAYRYGLLQRKALESSKEVELTYSEYIFLLSLGMDYMTWSPLLISPKGYMLDRMDNATRRLKGLLIMGLTERFDIFDLKSGECASQLSHSDLSPSELGMQRGQGRVPPC